MAAKKGGKALEAMGGAELLEVVFNQLNPVEGADWVFSEFSIDGVVDTAVFELCKTFGIESSDNSLMQTSIIIMCSVTVSEFAQHALSMGAGFAKVDFTAITLSQISKKVDKLLSSVDKLIREPLKSASSFLKQAETHLRIGDIKRALELMDKVNTKATKALSLLDYPGNDDKKNQDLVTTTQLLILSSILRQSAVNTNMGPVLIPIHKLPEKKKKDISKLVTSHLETLIGMVEKNKTSGYTITGWVKKMLSRKNDKKEEARRDGLDQILKSCFPLISTTTTIMDAYTVQLTLPHLKFLPDGEEDLTHTMVSGPSGSRSKINIWAELKEKMVNMQYNGVHYSASVEGEVDSSPVLTIRKGRIVKISTGDLKITKDWPTEISGRNVNSAYWPQLAWLFLWIIMDYYG